MLHCVHTCAQDGVCDTIGCVYVDAWVYMHMLTWCACMCVQDGVFDTGTVCVYGCVCGCMLHCVHACAPDVIYSSVV